MAGILGTLTVTGVVGDNPPISGSILLNGNFVSRIIPDGSNADLFYEFYGTKKENNNTKLDITENVAAIKAALFGTVTNEVIDLTVEAKGTNDEAVSFTMSVPVSKILWGKAVAGDATKSHVYILNQERAAMRYKVDETLAEIIALV